MSENQSPAEKPSLHQEKPLPKYADEPLFQIGDYCRTKDGYFGTVMTHFVTRQKRGRLYMLEDIDESTYLVNEPFLELILEAKYNVKG